MILEALLQADTYDGYAYSYPHKTAYRPFDPPIPLPRLWSGEDKSKLFLYLHLPFCEMRCGFCNLFTTIRPGEDFVERTLGAIERQSHEVAKLIEAEGVAQVAVGGGTPSSLSAGQLERVFEILERDWSIDLGRVPFSLEVSPSTVDPQKLSLLKSLGVSRLSMGVQSFLAEDLEALRRPLLGADLHQVCGWIKEAGFPVFNLDLIYGVEGQTSRRWQKNLDKALFWQPEEIYLYPLYVGKLTRLDHLGRRPADQRRALYRQGRECLLAAGYEQLSMRLFRRPGAEQVNEYCCQQDGMVGLGPGARSYTREVHYSSDYAVGQPGVKEIIRSFAELDYGCAHYGVFLNLEEQKRRFLLKSILRVEGLELELYRGRFQAEVMTDFPQLAELLALDLATLGETHLLATEEGLAYSDTIGPWLYSESVRRGMMEYELR